MKKIFAYLVNKHAEVFKFFLFVISVAAIVAVFPKQSKFKYDLKNVKGKPWNYDNLVAPFDFAIHKTDEEISAERSDVISNSRPYFLRSVDVPVNVGDDLKDEFDSQWPVAKTPALREKSLVAAHSILDSIYKRGIIQITDEFETRPADYDIYVITDNVEEEAELGNFFTIRTVQEKIDQLLRKTHEADTSFVRKVVENVLEQNIFYDKETSEKVLKQSIDGIFASKGRIVKDQSIITKGEIVDPKKYQLLESLKAEFEEQSGGGSAKYYSILMGQIIIIALCLLVLGMFLFLLRKDIFVDNTKVAFILFLIILFVLITTNVLRYEKANIYVIPFCILPIVIRAFFDTRMALFAHIINILIISFLSSERFVFAFIEIIAGMVSIFTILNLRNRSQFFITTVIVFAAYFLSYIGINIIQEGDWSFIDYSIISWFGVSALMTLFSYPLIFLFEKTFGFISDVSLMELSDANSPLLRELASKAPGTFQHSLQVANIAEDVIYQIGGNPLLIRTGALYHDIGKMENPSYFIENQGGGFNPHNDMNYEDSSAIIIGHVIKGIELAKKHKLPEQIIDFIRTHHGTSTTAYFLKMYKKEHESEEMDESLFKYPGPIPFSKETAVLMMADSAEAASRSLKVYNDVVINELVDRIIDTQIGLNQYVNSDITFKDITIIKKTLKKKLMNMYHVRIEYPR